MTTATQLAATLVKRAVESSDLVTAEDFLLRLRAALRDAKTPGARWAVLRWFERAQAQHERES